ncbi:glycopeptide resistance accessory protein VanW [Aminipila sp.]|uniref:glycopeptide resistance accessory protein VanW n=1 Tax=Aminipila sp. TaxID=2060095 RepID=UPI00289D532D|nr:glycopeptide resistance accessory protein VanW [Aminipila sp.]
MKRKRITQIFPWLIPLRTKQRKFCFYLGMRLDGHKYCTTQCADRLPILVYESVCPMYNRDTGFDLVYQENKVFNLKLAAITVDNMLIRPGETFSFSRATRYADRETPYKDGLVVVNGKLTTAPGGGMCQLTNLLFWVFLHSPLTIVERHGHRIKDFPESPSDAPIGVDATISEGWLDLKVRNDTEKAFQINIDFDDERIIGRIFASEDDGIKYQVKNEEVFYYRKHGAVFEEVDVIQKKISKRTDDCIATKTLYRNKCEIGYTLPESTPIVEKG